MFVNKLKRYVEGTGNQRKLPRSQRNRAVEEPLLIPLCEAMMGKYYATALEARKDYPLNILKKTEGRPLGETVVFEPVIKSGTIDVGGPVRIRRP